MDFLLNAGKYILISFLSLIAPIQHLLIMVGVLIMADFVLGVAAAIKRKEKITSAGFGRSIVKMFVYQVVVVSGYFIQVLLGNTIPVVNLICGVIALTEGKSLLENTEEVTGLNLLKIKNALKSKNDEKQD
jgi:phage-related holin